LGYNDIKPFYGDFSRENGDFYELSPYNSWILPEKWELTSENGDSTKRNDNLQQARIVNLPVLNNHEHITIYIV